MEPSQPLIRRQASGTSQLKTEVNLPKHTTKTNMFHKQGFSSLQPCRAIDMSETSERERGYVWFNARHDMMYAWMILNGMI
jgi:hypothetical protein